MLLGLLVIYTMNFTYVCSSFHSCNIKVKITGDSQGSERVKDHLYVVLFFYYYKINQFEKLHVDKSI